MRLLAKIIHYIKGRYYYAYCYSNWYKWAARDLKIKGKCKGVGSMNTNDFYPCNKCPYRYIEYKKVSFFGSLKNNEEGEK